MKHSAITAIVLLAAVPCGAFAAEMSVWAVRDDVGTTPASIAFNPASGNLLIAGSSIHEWARGATSGTLLVPADNWGGGALGSAYIPGRNSYMVTDSSEDRIIEVLSGQSDQVPAIFVDMVPPTFPAGGMVQDGAYAYYKNQWTGMRQTVNRFTLAGTNGLDSVYVPKSAFDEWFSSGPDQKLAMSVDHTLYLSARNSAVKANKGIYRWDVTSNALIPVIQEPAIKAHTGQNNAGVKGLTIDARGNFYFFDVYSFDILMLSADGDLSTFLTGTQIKSFMAAQGLSSPDSLNPAYMVIVGCGLVFISGNISGHVLVATLTGYGDFNRDVEIDTQDTAIFAAAMTGPVAVIPPDPDQERVDHNADGHVDLVDFAAYQRAVGDCP